jgi:hypothetical protein
MIYSQIKIADNFSYIPAAFVTDDRQGYEFRKGMHLNGHTTEKLQLLKKKELSIQVLKRRVTLEYNSLEAFDTLMHSEPGKYGLFQKEIIITSYPIQSEINH